MEKYTILCIKHCFSTAKDPYKPGVRDTDRHLKLFQRGEHWETHTSHRVNIQTPELLCNPPDSISMQDPEDRYFSPSSCYCLFDGSTVFCCPFWGFPSSSFRDRGQVLSGPLVIKPAFCVPLARDSVEGLVSLSNFCPFWKQSSGFPSTFYPMSSGPSQSPSQSPPLIFSLQ